MDRNRLNIEMTNPRSNPNENHLKKYVVQESTESEASDELNNYILNTSSKNKKSARKQAGKAVDKSASTLTKETIDKSSTEDNRSSSKTKSNKFNTNTKDSMSFLNTTNEFSKNELSKNDSFEAMPSSTNEPILSDSASKELKSKKNKSIKPNESYFDESSLSDLENSKKSDKNVVTVNYNIKMKRARKTWTDKEVAFLKSGAKKFKGQKNIWSQILKTYDFNDRTAIDLKDKYRIISKSTSYHKLKNRAFCLLNEKGEPVKNYNGEVSVYHQRFPYDAAVRVANVYKFENNVDFSLCERGKKLPLYTYTVTKSEEGITSIRAKKATYKDEKLA